MPTLLHLVDLITSDTLTLAATGILTVAVLALLVLIAWPSRAEAARAEPARARQARVSPPYTASHRDAGGKPRAATARALAASGTAIVDIARRTGLSRDALVLMSGMTGMTGKSGSATATARQKAPAAARLSLFQRLRGTGGATATGTQVPA
ncbi:MAG: hypothetical protein IPF98_06000 [Gemmatimonadetes bacterium]|nr:hypothetical protein [Gemmatimonadota bacterium]